MNSNGIQSSSCNNRSNSHDEYIYCSGDEENRPEPTNIDQDTNNPDALGDDSNSCGDEDDNEMLNM